MSKWCSYAFPLLVVERRLTFGGATPLFPVQVWTDFVLFGQHGEQKILEMVRVDPNVRVHVHRTHWTRMCMFMSAFSMVVFSA